MTSDHQRLQAGARNGPAQHSVSGAETAAVIRSREIAAGHPGGDPSLAARLRQRDPQAFRQLYDRVSGRAFGLAYRILGDGAAAEDVVQEAFISLWKQADRIDPDRGLVESLLMTVVHRRSIDHLRAARRREPVNELPVEDPIDWRAAEMLDQVGETLTHESVRDAMLKLPVEQREAIELAYFEGLTHSEIADSTGAPVGTVKSRLRLGINRLRSEFGLRGAS